MILPQKSGSDLRFDLSRGGKEQLAFAGLAGGFPLHFGSTRCRKKSDPRFVVAQRRHRLLIALEFKIRTKPVQSQRNNGTGRDGEVEVSTVGGGLAKSGHELQRDWKCASLWENQLVNRDAVLRHKTQPIAGFCRNRTGSRNAGENCDFCIVDRHNSSAAVLKEHRVSIRMRRPVEARLGQFDRPRSCTGSIHNQP